MTKAQERVINHIKKELPRFDFYSEDGYEIKKFEVTPLEGCGIISVYIETGMKNDEGTLAEALCRKHRHFFVGVRGGIETAIYNGNHVKGSFRRVTPFELLNRGYAD